ncbi:MAG: sigma-54-dependent Fis family transcriptional regulator [Rhodocyclaceae bacterium]|nr:sigma-54-dependent Fis family transcriptional regulator [Rhodocyclaceae bacterium]
MKNASSVADDRPWLLIVDDDPLITESLGYFLGGDFQIRMADTREGGMAAARAMPRPPELALVDLGLPPHPHRPDEGFALVGDLLALSPSMRIIILSGQSEETNARHARALGATEFIAKPADPEALRQALTRALSFRAAELSPTAESGDAFVGDSPPVRKLREQVRQYADSPFPVLIEGESGSGKEIVAQAFLHRLTHRRHRPYLALNCAAISPSLVEPTLFGYAKGSFTGAVQAKSGYFEEADDGTLFLDEIGELPLELQPKLLRVLENGEYQRVGETFSRHSRARIIAATNRDLRREVREGRFRADLYHRLSVFTVVAPPLRETGRDRLLLLDHFRTLYSRQTGSEPFSLTPEAEAAWMAYGFPGNARELRNIVIRLVAKHAGKAIGVQQLREEFDMAPPEGPGAAWDLPLEHERLVQLALRQLQARDGFDLDGTLRQWEFAYVEAAQRLAHGNLSQAARLLGVNRTTLYNRIAALARTGVDAA